MSIFYRNDLVTEKKLEKRLETEADLVNGKVPTEQLPTPPQWTIVEWVDFNEEEPFQNENFTLNKEYYFTLMDANQYRTIVYIPEIPGEEYLSLNFYDSDNETPAYIRIRYNSVLKQFEFAGKSGEVSGFYISYR